MVRAVNSDVFVGKEIERSAHDGGAWHEFAPLSGWGAMGESEHFVQFYEDEAFLLDSLSGFVGAGLRQGDACLVVATQAHREDLEQRLRDSGLDIDSAVASGQYVSLDAFETLSKFMVDGSPDPTLFAEVIGEAVSRAAEGHERVRIFGEMVALIWADENYDGAHKLEGLWNELHQVRAFALFCAYPMNARGINDMHLAALGGICDSHSRVIPAESYTTLTDPEERLRAISLLQQKAGALQTVKDELEVQVEDLRRLHEMSVRLTTTLDVESLLQEVLRAAMAVHGTDLGLLSLCDEARDGLNVKASSGFDEEVLKAIEWIPAGEGACGSCYEQRRRIVVEDTEADEVFTPYREATRAAGVRACHSTPLITRGGHSIGVLSVHFRHPHRPSLRETRLMDLYARMAADILENAQLHQRAQQELEERQQSLAREQRARAEAERANRLKDEFLATVSHELRTPLTAIVGWTDMLRSGQLDERAAANALVTIERNARSQTQIVEDLLDVSRIITGKLRLDVRPLNPASLIETAIETVRPAAEARGVRIQKMIEAGIGAVAADPARMQQVVWNLLSNAIKFTPRGGRVEVRVERVDSHVEISVRDDGAGIEAEFLPYVFDRFSQADMSSTRKHGGLGLGLAIVRHLVELHGGTVAAESEGAGHGSTFKVTLPLLSVYQMDAALAGMSTATVKPTLPLECHERIDGVRILVVEDETETRELLQMMLEQRGADVTVATSAREALEQLQHTKPDVLISDIGMPEEDGYELIRQVRALTPAQGGRVPAVALTAYARTEDRLQALRAGYQMHVPKPVELAELVAVVSSLAGRGA